MDADDKESPIAAIETTPIEPTVNLQRNIKLINAFAIAIELPEQTAALHELGTYSQVKACLTSLPSHWPCAAST